MDCSGLSSPCHHQKGWSWPGNGLKKGKKEGWKVQQCFCTWNCYRDPSCPAGRRLLKCSRTEPVSLFDLDKVTERWLSLPLLLQAAKVQGAAMKLKEEFFLAVCDWMRQPVCTRSLNGSKITREMYEGNGWNAGDKHNPSLWEGLSCRELGAVDPAGATLPRNVCLIILFSWTYAVGHCWRQDHRLASPFTNLLMWKPEAYFCFSTERWTNTWEKNSVFHQIMHLYNKIKTSFPLE